MINALRNSLDFAGSALSILSTEVRGMHAAAYVLALSSLFSSLLALLRDRLLAHTFGAGAELDLYFAAFRIPDFLFVFVGSLVTVYVLIPALASKNDSEQRVFLDSVVVGFSALAVVTSAFAWLTAPQLLHYFFPALMAIAGDGTLLELTRILLLQPFLLGLSNIAASVTQSGHRYLLYATTPIVYNLGIIFGILILYPWFGLHGVVFGVTIGAFGHLAIQLPYAFRAGFFQLSVRRFEPLALFETVRVSIPRAIALSMSQIGLFGLIAFAGTLANGSISIFTFAFNLQAVPLGIIGASYSVAAFPALSKLAQNRSEEFVAYVTTAARHIIFWSLPALALLIILRAHIVRVILGTGSFDWVDTRLTAASLALFAVSLGAQGISLLLIRAYYASGKTAVPLIAAGLGVLSTLFLAFFFLRLFAAETPLSFLEALFRVRDIAGLEVLALPLAFSISGILATLMLVVHFNRLYRTFVPSLTSVFWESVTAAFFAAIAAYVVLVVLGNISFTSTLASVLLRGGLAGVVGIVTAGVVYALLGSAEFGEVVAALRRKLWRGATVVSSSEEYDALLR